MIARFGARRATLLARAGGIPENIFPVNAAERMQFPIKNLQKY
jgi:hypothetical protein